LNIVPAECHFELELRNLPEEDPLAMLEEVKHFAREQVAPELRTAQHSVELEWAELAHFAGLDSSEDEEIVQLARRLTRKERVRKVGFGTEAGSFSRTGIQSVVCGPGSISQAHTPDEYIEIGQLAECERFIGDLIQELSESQ